MIYEDIALVPFFRSWKGPIFPPLYWQSCYWFQWKQSSTLCICRTFSVPIFILQDKAFPLGCFTYSLLKWTLWCVKYAACIRPIPRTAALKHSSYSPSTVTSGFYHETFPVSRHKRLSYVHKTKPCQRLTAVKHALLNAFSPRIFVIIFTTIEMNLKFSRFSSKYFNWVYNKALRCTVFYPRSFFGKGKRLANE